MRTKSLLASLVITTTAQFLAYPACAAWRGDGSGLYPDAQPTMNWSSQINVAWRTPLPSWSNSGVAKLGHKLFVCAEPNALICVDARNGRTLWRRDNPGEITLSDTQRKAFDAAKQSRETHDALAKQLRDVQKRLKRNPGSGKYTLRELQLAPQVAAAEAEIKDSPPIPTAKGHADTGESTPTPLADAERGYVYASFASGVVVAYSLEGERIWARALSMGPSKYGHTSSPVLTRRRLIVSHGNISGLDPDTGDTVWSVKTKATHGTPVLTDIGDTRVLISPSGLCLRSSDGGLVCDNLPHSDFNSPIVHRGTVYYVGIGGNTAAAYSLPRQTYSPSPARKLWEAKVRDGRYFASPVLHKDTLFGLRQSGRLVAFDAKSGRKLKEQMFDVMHTRFGQCYTSLSVADDRLFVFSDNGTVLVLSATPQFSLMRKTSFQKIRGNPHFEGKRIYLRGMASLFCIEK